MPFENRKKIKKKNILKNWGSFHFSVVTIKKKYHPSGNLKLIDLGIFQSLKFRILMEKNPSNFF